MFFLFDNGGTLIDDPFAEALAALRADGAAADALAAHGLPADAWAAFLTAWAEENDRFSFPFASHFVQEETWVNRALLRLARGGTLDAGAVPDLAPRILARYRAAARALISAQPQHATIKAVFARLKDAGHGVGVASNDRAVSTHALMSWTGYAAYLDVIVASEEMSSPDRRIEKPDRLFFSEALARIGAAGAAPRRVVYIGDSETNDVATPKAMGIATVRYINARNPKSRAWLDHSETTAADYSYTDVAQMPALFATILAELG